MSIEHVEIYPKIFVYKNMFKDLDGLLDAIKQSEINPEGSIMSEWEDWYTFGTEIDTFNLNLEKTDRVAKEEEQIQDVNKVFYEVVNDYFKKHNVEYSFDLFLDEVDGEEKSKWIKMGPSICKYNPDKDVADNLAMQYHTDYQIEKRDSRGYNFSVSVTMYLNDDYEGGGIDFYINEKLFYYKPEAGDIIVFPAGDPGFLTEDEELYRHGVRNITGSPKYFIRNNMLRFNEGTEEWIKNQSLYGKDLWQQMEQEKWKANREIGFYQEITEKEIESAVRIK